MKRGMLQFVMVDEKITFDAAMKGVEAHLKKSKFTQKGEVTVLRSQGLHLNDSLVRVDFTNGIGPLLLSQC